MSLGNVDGVNLEVCVSYGPRGCWSMLREFHHHVDAARGRGIRQCYAELDFFLAFDDRRLDRFDGCSQFDVDLEEVLLSTACCAVLVAPQAQ